MPLLKKHETSSYPRHKPLICRSKNKTKQNKTYPGIKMLKKFECIIPRRSNSAYEQTVH